MKRGFTLIELLAVIVIIAVIALIATPIILGIISDSKKSAFKDAAYGIIEAAKNEYISEMYKTGNPSNITFTYTNGVESSSVADKTLNYSGSKPSNGIVTLTSNGDVAIAIHDGTNCVYKSYNDSEVILETKALSECTADYSITKGINAPKLAESMTPIKWNGTTWTETTVSDKDWYSYDTTNKKWANARTADGSMWVWIPRYIYKITSGWHSNTTGTIEVQFSKGTNDNWNSSTIGNINTDTTANASNNTWTNHPGFTFGSTELTGIWVAKFEASNDGSGNVKIIPNVISWRNITIGNAFDKSRSMEINSTYGWGTTGTNIDTHMAKDTEWGLVAYLAKSTYGKNLDIWINPADNYTTGCAGDSASSSLTIGCLRTYDTVNGQQASTTGNIYGIYDMSGGAWEYTASYVNNENSNLNNGLSILNAEEKYKDEYEMGENDNQTSAYSLTINQKGNAIYETSSVAIGLSSWYGDSSSMPRTDWPWINRSGGPGYANDAGLYYFTCYIGSSNPFNGFRPILVVASGI